MSAGGGRQPGRQTGGAGGPALLPGPPPPRPSSSGPRRGRMARGGRGGGRGRAEGGGGAGPAEGPRTFRERPLDPARALPVLRALAQVEDPAARAALREAAGGRGRGGARGRAGAGSPLPGVRVASPGAPRVGGERWEPPRAYIRRGSLGAEAGPGLGYDLESDDEEWLKRQPEGGHTAEGRTEGRHGLGGAAASQTPPGEGQGEGALMERQLESLLHLLDLATASLQAAGDLTADAALDALSWPVAQRVLRRDRALRGAAMDALRRGWEYYIQKRRRLGRPLVRALQPPPGKDDANPYNLFCGKKTPQKQRAEKRGRKKRAAQRPSAGGRGHKKKVVERLPAFHMDADAEILSEHIPEPVPVVCGELRGLLLPNCALRAEVVELPGGEQVSGAEFERRAGRGAHRRWKMSSKISGVYVADWLRIGGVERGGAGLVGSLVAVLRRGSFRPGVVVDFDALGGQHHVRFADGRQEWLHVHMQSIRVLAGRAEEIGVPVFESPCNDTARITLGAAEDPRLAAMPQASDVTPRGNASGDGGEGLLHWISRVVASVGRAHGKPATPGGDSGPQTAQGYSPTPVRGAFPARKLISSLHGVSPSPAGDSDGQGSVPPELIHVTCGPLRGTLLPGCRVREEKILCDGKEITPAEFERLGGRANTKKWKKSIHVELKGCVGPRVGTWLRARGAELGQRAVGSRVGIFWPEDGVFYWGRLLEFNPGTGEHLLQYDDLEQEWLYINLQLVKWEKGAVAAGRHPPHIGRRKAGSGGAARRPLDVLNS